VRWTGRIPCFEVFSPLLFTTLLLEAQVNTATLLGSVKDATGAVVPKASVTAKNLATGLARSVVTDGAGNYVVSNLPAGHYSISASLTGFKTTVMADIELQVAQQATVNPELQVGQTTEVNVIDSPLINSVNSEVGQVVDPRAVESMPLNGRSFWQLTQLTPGAAYIPGGQNVRAGGTSIARRLSM